MANAELGRGEEAARCWEQALKEDPQHLEATFNYGYYRWNRGERYEKVLQSQMANLDGAQGNRPEYWRLLAWLYYERGEVEELKGLKNVGGRFDDPEFLKWVQNPDNPTRTFEGMVVGHCGRVFPGWQIRPLQE